MLLLPHIARPAPRLASLAVLSTGAEQVLRDARQVCRTAHRVGSLGELRRVLEELAPAAAGPRILDLLGHSTRSARLLRLGSTIVDMTVPAVARFFTDLAADRLLARHALVGVRLLGCATAAMPTGQLTIRLLARTLGVPVWGTRTPLLHAHYDDRGFDPRFAHLLIESAELPSPLQPLA